MRTEKLCFINDTFIESIEDSESETETSICNATLMMAVSTVMPVCKRKAYADTRGMRVFFSIINNSYILTCGLTCRFLDVVSGLTEQICCGHFRMA